MKRTLILCAVGQPLHDFENHWRRTDLEPRLYETTVVNYNYQSGFKPEAVTYDSYYEDRGNKWNMAKRYIQDNLERLMSEYDYIGVWDDDVQTTINDVNNSIQKATELNAMLWQISLRPDSDIHWKFLINNPELEYSITNFIEIMCPFFHTSLLPTMLEFWNSYEFDAGWGFDVVGCDILKHNATVIHTSQMYHPPKDESQYDKSDAFAEMRWCLGAAYRQFMRDKYGIHAETYDEVQKVLYEKARV